MITMELSGDVALEQKLTELALKTRKQIRARACKAGGMITMHRARALAALIVGGSTGALIAGALQVRVAKAKSKSDYMVRVQHSEKYNDKFVHYTGSGQRYYIPSAIEHGHAAPGRGGGKSAPKDVAPRPYMRPALEQTRQAAGQAMIDTLTEGIMREWAK